MFYENVTWMGILRKQLGRYTNCKPCIAVDLILAKRALGWEGSDTLFI